jgi:hypothetical protein
MLPRRKIYIDSRYKTQDSKSNANFKIQLNENLKFPDNCGFYITDICIPNTSSSSSTFPTNTLAKTTLTANTLATNAESYLN